MDLLDVIEKFLANNYSMESRRCVGPAANWISTDDFIIAVNNKCRSSIYVWWHNGSSWKYAQPTLIDMAAPDGFDKLSEVVEEHL